MKIKKLAVPQSALVVEGMADYRPRFESKEAMVAYYMQMNEFVNYGLKAPAARELPYMVGLVRKLKKFVLFLQQLSEHKWCDGVGEIQTMCSAYMMKEDVSMDKRTQVSESISELMAFLIYVAENKGVLKQIHGITAAHYKNVMELILERVDQEPATDEAAPSEAGAVEEKVD